VDGERWAALDGAEVRAAFGGRLPDRLTVAGPSTIPAPPPDGCAVPVPLGAALACRECGRGFVLGAHGLGDDGPRDLCPACAAPAAVANAIGGAS
jgi:hypothetical protein